MKKQIVIIHGGDAFKTYKEYITFLKNYQLNFKKNKDKGLEGFFRRKIGQKF